MGRGPKNVEIYHDLLLKTPWNHALTAITVLHIQGVFSTGPALDGWMDLLVGSGPDSK